METLEERFRTQSDGLKHHDPTGCDIFSGGIAFPAAPSCEVQQATYFADRHSSHIMAQVGYSAAAVPSVLNLLVMAAGRDVVSLVGLVAVMVIQDPLMSLVGVLAMPVAMLFPRDLLERVRNTANEKFVASANILETVQETLHGMRIVKAYGLENEMRRRVNASAEAVKVASAHMARLTNRSSPTMEALGGVVIALTFLYGGYRVIELGATAGEFVSFVTAFLLAYEPAKRLARLHLDLNMQLVGVLRQNPAVPERCGVSFALLRLARWIAVQADEKGNLAACEF